MLEKTTRDCYFAQEKYNKIKSEARKFALEIKCFIQLFEEMVYYHSCIYIYIYTNNNNNKKMNRIKPTKNQGIQRNIYVYIYISIFI